MSALRFTKYLQEKASVERQLGQVSCSPIRLTPGQYAQLKLEAGREVTQFATCQGMHEVQVIQCHIRATGDNVIMCPREDLFQETDRGSGIELVSTANSVTSVPDNIGCVEILSVGPLVQGFTPGEIVFIDFFRVKQGYIVAGEELYIADGDSLAAKYDPDTQTILPLDNTVIAKAAPRRFSAALTGQDQILVPEMTTTDGIVSGRTSGGGEAAHSVYAEVVSVGRLTRRPHNGTMSSLERKVLDLLTQNEAMWCDEYGHEEAAAINALIDERKNGRESDLHPGDLVTFCLELGTKVRCRGDYQWIVAYDSALAVIDEEKLLEDKRKSKPSGLILGIN